MKLRSALVSLLGYAMVAADSNLRGVEVANTDQHHRHLAKIIQVFASDFSHVTLLHPGASNSGDQDDFDYKVLQVTTGGVDPVPCEKIHEDFSDAVLACNAANTDCIDLAGSNSNWVADNNNCRASPTGPTITVGAGCSGPDPDFLTVNNFDAPVGVLVDKLAGSDTGQMLKINYPAMEAFAVKLNNAFANPSLGLTFTLYCDGQPVVDVDGEFDGWIGVIANVGFDSVKVRRADPDPSQTGEAETFYMDDIEIVPWCSPTGINFHGDPHIKTWQGQYFDYMGECDLVMMNAPNLEDPSKNIDIHARTTIRYDYSYIESAAVRIGEDILEVGSFGSHFFNGVEGAFVSGSKGLNMAGYPVHYRQESKQKHVFDIVLSPRMNITATTFKDIVNVKVSGNDPALFKDAIGLMGLLNGELVGRDGKTDLSAEPNALADEWQVNDKDPMLFQTMRAPQYPAKCVLPDPAKSAERRLGEGAVSKTAAEMACARFQGTAFENCVYDVMAFGDLEYANAGAF